MSELIAYNEPHPSGGNCLVTMTRKQAIVWAEKSCPSGFNYETEQEALEDFIVVHWAYWIPSDSYSKGYKAGIIEGASQYGGMIIRPEDIEVPPVSDR